MKRLKISAFFIFILLFCHAFTSTVSAEEVSEEFSDFIGSLPDGIKDSLPENVNGNDPESDAKKITSWDFLLSALGGGIADGFRRIIPTFCALLGLILISSVMGTLKTSLEPKTANVLGMCGSSVIAVVFVSLQIATVHTVAEYLTDLLTLVNSMTPAVVVLYASGGNVAGASVSASAMSVFMSFCENVLARTVVPFSGICLCLVTVTAVAPDIGLDRLIALVKNVYTKSVTLLMSLFCAILAAQSAIAAGSDSISLRAVKFVTGSAIPIVGGSVNESMKLLAGRDRKSVV